MEAPLPSLWDVNEATFRRHVCAELWAQLDPSAPLVRERSAEEVRIGAFALDLVAENANEGLTIVEFKVNMSKEALGQMLLYPRALKAAVERPGTHPAPAMRMVLVSPFIDRGVAELARELSASLCTPLVLRLCVERDGRWALIDPLSPDAPKNQCYRQDDAPPERTSVRWGPEGLFAGRQIIWAPSAYERLCACDSLP